ncbi:MAG: sigma-70 family RNA polymerase sigma factor [Anaerolineae bacterium]
MPPDEQRLIQRAQADDPEAVSRLYRRHVESIYRYIHLRVGRQDLAEDLTGDVFVRALEALRTYEYRGVPFSAWLYRIAHDRVVDYYRREARREEDVLVEEPEDAERGPASTLEAGLARDRLGAALRRLTPDQQMVISLKFGEDMTNAQVAELMDKTEGAVKSLQHRALASLKRFMDEERSGESVKRAGPRLVPLERTASPPGEA